MSPVGHASESLSLRVVLWTQCTVKTLTRRKLDSLYIIRESDFRTVKNIKGKKRSLHNDQGAVFQRHVTI